MKYIPRVLVLVMLVATGFTTKQWMNSKRELEVADQNMAAAVDSTQRVLMAQVEASTRLATQSQIEAGESSDAMFEALRQRNAALVTLNRTRIQMDSVVALRQEPRTDTVFVENGDTIRVATFPMAGPPIEGEQVVRAGPRITLDSRLRVSPFSIAYGVACSGTAPVFTWDTPDWVRTEFERGTVDPSVCYTPAPSLFEISTPKIIWLILGLGLGLGVGSL
jgi:hypothetical protein